MDKEILWVQWVHPFYIKGKDINTVSTPKHACWLVRKIFDAREWLEDATNVAGTWDKYSVMGRFSIKKAYLAMLPKFPKPMWKKLALVTSLLPRHHFVMWLTLHKRLSTVDRLSRWGISLIQSVPCAHLRKKSLKTIFSLIVPTLDICGKHC